MSRIFLPQKLNADATIEITKEEHHYISRVLRMKKGDPLYLFNGGDEEFDAKILDVQKNKTIVSIGNKRKINKESPIEIAIAQGIPKGQKIDEMIPRITELGATALTPLITERSDLKKISPLKILRWQKIARSSTEQTGRTKILRICPPSTLSELLQRHPEHEKILFYELEESLTLEEALRNSSSQKFCLIIGPEGGFSKREIEEARKQGCKIVTLGKRILRTETVAPAVTAIFQYVKGDLGRNG